MQTGKVELTTLFIEIKHRVLLLILLSSNLRVMIQSKLDSIILKVVIRLVQWRVFYLILIFEVAASFDQV